MASLTGTWTLTRVVIKRERVRLSLWVLGLALLMMLVARAATNLLTTQEDLVTFTRVFAVNPVFRMLGLASGATTGAFIMTRSYLLFAILVPLMSTFTIVRNTRENEDAGITQLIGSHAVGRHASLAAAFTVTALANLLLGLLIVPALLINDLPLTGSIAMGATLGAIGIAFAAIAALAAQAAGTARAAKGLTLSAIGASFALAGIGNVLGTLDATGLVVESHWIAWLSPLGWGQQLRPFSENHGWVLLLFAAFTLLTLLAAIIIERHRDVGHALLPQRRGPEHASFTLPSATGLAWRLQRGPFLGWATALTLLAAVYGVTVNEVEGLFDEIDQARAILEQIGGTAELVDAYLTMVLTLLGTLVAVYALLTVLKMRTEEHEGRLDPILATNTSRATWLTGTINNALLGTLALLALVGTALGLSVGWVLDEPTAWVLPVLQAAIAQAPSALLVASIGIAAYGLFPHRAGAIAWVLFAAAFVTGPIFGPILDLPQALQNLSPFTHAPSAPADAITMMPLVLMLGAAVALTVTGFVAFQRRDVSTKG